MIAQEMAAIALLAALVYANPAPAQSPTSESPQREEVTAILQDLAADYRHDPMAISSTFGIRIGDDWWTVDVARKEEAYPAKNKKFTLHRFGPHQVVLRDGQPASPTWYFDIADPAVLKKISNGEINAGTAAMQSFGSDRVGVEVEAMEKFEMTPAATAEMYHAMSHFWTRGVPEITHFARDKSLPTHGAAAVSLYTMKDKRLAWFSIGPQETANADSRLESGQVPNLFIITGGRGRALLADEEVELKEGMSIFIPPYTRHVISNPYDEPLEGILVLFGDNSDFIHGKSYPASVEELNAFYGSGGSK